MKRRNNADISPIVWVLVGLLIAVVGTILILNWNNLFKKTGNDVATTANELFASLTDELKMQYDDQLVSGTGVKECLEKVYTDYTSDQVIVTVITKANATGKDYKATSKYAIADNDTNNVDYINPSGVFHGMVHVNNNGICDHITFTQQ